MLGHTIRSRLAGFASKPILHHRTISATPALHHNMINLKDALSGKLRNSWTDEILTSEGPRNMNKLAAALAQASLKDKHAHNCNLLLTPSPVSLADLPVIGHGRPRRAQRWRSSSMSSVWRSLVLGFR